MKLRKLPAMYSNYVSVTEHGWVRESKCQCGVTPKCVSEVKDIWLMSESTLLVIEETVVF